MSARRTVASSFVSTLAGLIGLSMLATPAAAYMWIETLTPDYLRGDLVWQQGGGAVSWEPNARSSSEFFEFNPRFAGSTASHTEYTVPFYTQWEAGFYSGSFPEPTRFEFQSAPLPETLHLNGSRLVQVHLIVKTAPRFPTGGCYDDSFSMDVKLYLHEKFIGGARGNSRYDSYSDGASFSSAGRFKTYTQDGYDASPNLPSDLCLVIFGIPAEEPVWEKGGVLKFQFLFRYQRYEAHIKVDGSPRSFVAIPTYSDTELLFRTDDAASPAVEDVGGEDSDPEAMLALGLMGLPLLAVGRLGPRRLLVVLLVVSLFMAGCTGADATPASADDPIDRGEVEQTFVPGESGGPNGTIVGVILDEFRRPVSGAHISVIGQSVFDTSDGLGRFELANLRPGKYSIRVDREGFRTFESKNALNVMPGKTTYVEITLELLVKGEGGAAPHTHSYWAGDSKVLIEDLEVGRINSMIKRSFAIPPPDSPLDYNSVLPGTYMMHVTLKWTSPDVPLMSLEYTNAFKPANTLNATYLYPRASGETFRIPITWEMQDPGHQHYSFWSFAFEPTWFSYTASSKAQAAPFPVYATIEIFRGGRLPIEAPHQDRWGSNLTLALGELKGNAPYCTNLAGTCSGRHDGSSPTSSMNVSFSPEVVPIGTEWIEVKATLSHASLVEPATYKVAYKTGLTPPGTCGANQPPDKVDARGAQWVSGDPSGTEWLWRIPLRPGDADPFYATATSWCIWLYRDSATYAGYWADYAQCQPGCTAPAIKMVLNATALRSEATSTVDMG